MVKKILLLFIAVFLVSNLNSVANAQADSLRITTDNPNYEVLQAITPSRYVSTVINLLLGGAGVVSFIFILIGGIRWITAGGDKDGSNNARKIILHAVTGLAIVFSAYALLYTFRFLFNVDLISVSVSEIGANSSSSSSSISSATACIGTECETESIPDGMCPCVIEGTCAKENDVGRLDPYCYLCTDDGWIVDRLYSVEPCDPITCEPCN